MVVGVGVAAVEPALLLSFATVMPANRMIAEAMAPATHFWSADMIPPFKGNQGCLLRFQQPRKNYDSL
jgi:hypothetical protein